LPIIRYAVFGARLRLLGPAVGNGVHVYLDHTGVKYIERRHFQCRVIRQRTSRPHRKAGDYQICASRDRMLSMPTHVHASVPRVNGHFISRLLALSNSQPLFPGSPLVTSSNELIIHHPYDELYYERYAAARRVTFQTTLKGWNALMTMLHTEFCTTIRAGWPGSVLHRDLSSLPNSLSAIVQDDSATSAKSTGDFCLSGDVVAQTAR